MSLPLLYEASVPVFRRLLGRLDAILERGERHAAGLGQPEAALLEARLAPDMYPMARQAVIAANFVPRAVAPLAAVEVVEFAADETSFAGLRRHAARQAAWLDGLAPALFEAAGERLCRSRAGLAEVVLPATEFLWHYALPNAHFHLSMAYAILRAAGVPLGKGDFDGFHVYAAAAR